jgi:hypothetical protein
MIKTLFLMLYVLGVRTSAILKLTLQFQLFETNLTIVTVNVLTDKSRKYL